MEELILVNPRRRKRGKRRYRKVSAHRNPRYRSRRRRSGRRHRNPRFGLPSVRGVGREVVPALIGAAGGIALDVGMGYAQAYLPDALKSGWGRTLALLAGALGIGYLGAYVPGVGRRNAQIMTLGALTVVAYSAIKANLPASIKDNVKGLDGLADFDDPQLGAYMPRGMGGYMNPAPALLASPLAANAGMGAYIPSNGSDFF